VERSLDVLDVRLRVESDDPDLVDAFFAVFAAFEVGPSARPPEGGEIAVRIDSARGIADVAGQVVTLAQGPLGAIHTYNLLFRALARSVSSSFLLHAAALSFGGRAFLVAGPSGSGKTSLARALSARGGRLLSDDIAPLSVRDGLVHPFPRRVGVVRGPDSPLGPTRIVLGSKEFLEPGALGAVVETAPLPLGAIVLLNPYAEDPTAVPVTVGVLGDGREFAKGLLDVPGIEVAGSHSAGGMTVIDLRATGGSACAAVDRAIEACEVDLVFHVRGYGDEKRYADRASLTRVSAREAGVELLRETLNREPASVMLRRHGGSVIAALVELTGLIARVDCYRLTPGPVEETAAVLREAFEGSAGRP